MSMEAVTYFLQKEWNQINECFGNDGFALFVWGTTMLSFLLYWGLGLGYTMMDYTGKPAFLLRYKIQDTQSYPVSLNNLLKVVSRVLINQILTIPLLIVAYELKIWKGYQHTTTLPGIPEIIFDLIIYTIIDEVGVYYSHRILHHRLFYKSIHKLHHEWTSPISISSSYCHPFEHIFSSELPMLVGPVLLNGHIITFWIWVAFSIFSGLSEHCGFHFPFLPSPEAHDYHHVKFNECFGKSGLLDWLHVTDKSFRNSKKFERHVTSFSTVPLKIQFPDDSKET